MDLPRDFSELLASFNANGVEYMLVGGYALAHHGTPRFTGDLDLYVHPTPDNARRIMAALEAFGFGSVGLTADDFCVPDRVIQLGRPPVRVDLLTGIDGVTWEQALAGVEACQVDGQPVPVIGLREFVTNKRASGRPTDLADLDSLGEA